MVKQQVRVFREQRIGLNQLHDRRCKICTNRLLEKMDWKGKMDLRYRPARSAWKTGNVVVEVAITQLKHFHLEIATKENG